MINSDLNRTPVEKHIAEVVIVEAVSINPVTVVRHGVKVVIVAGGSEVCEMANNEVKRGPAGSLIEVYMTDRNKKNAEGWLGDFSDRRAAEKVDR